MAVHLSIGLIRSASLAVSLVAVVGLAVVAVHFPIYPAPPYLGLSCPPEYSHSSRHSMDGLQVLINLVNNYS